MGLGWNEEAKNKFIDNPNHFTLQACTIQLAFHYDENEEELFTIDESDASSRRTRFNFFSFVIYSEPTESWQIVNLDYYKETPVFNFFSDHFSKVINLLNTKYKTTKFNKIFFSFRTQNFLTI